MSRLILTRRHLIRAGAVGVGGLLLSGCDRLFENRTFRETLESAEDLHQATQRTLGRDALAREFSKTDMSPIFRANGSREVADAAYQRHLQQEFAQWSLRVDGLVERPLDLPLSMLKGFRQRTQITRHDCVEGWSCIAKWTGTPLSRVLDEAGVKPAAQFVVFRCYDRYGGDGDLYYESCDMIDARHPQTMLAYGLNGRALPVANGAPVRVRIERALGYKQPKYVHTLELVSSFADIGRGFGGYWEDRGYDWFGGI